MRLHDLTPGQRFTASIFGRTTLCEVVQTGIENDGRGTIMLQRVWVKDGGQPTDHYHPMQSTFVVEHAWFTHGNHKVERVLI